MSVRTIPVPEASALYRGMVGVSAVLPDHSVSRHDPGPGGGPASLGSGSRVITVAVLRSLVLIVIATLLVLVALPAALVAAGT
jgi:hypothetical protein